MLLQIALLILLMTCVCLSTHAAWMLRNTQYIGSRKEGPPGKVFVFISPKTYTHAVGQGLNIQRQDAARHMALCRALHDINPDLLFEAPAFSTSMKATDGNVSFTDMHDPAPFPFLFYGNVPLTSCTWRPFDPLLNATHNGLVCSNTTLERVRDAAARYNKTPSYLEPNTLETMLRSPSEQLQVAASDTY